MSHVLLIETALHNSGIALWQTPEILVEVRQPLGEHGRTDSLHDAIAQAIQAHDLGWDDVALIAVSCGPGSFTGIRVGLAAAQGLALARQIPLLGLSTLTLLAASVEKVLKKEVCVCLPARKDAFYVQQGQQGSAAFVEKHELAQHIPPGVVLCGEGAYDVWDALPPAHGITLAKNSAQQLITSIDFKVMGTMAWGLRQQTAQYPPQPVYVAPLTYRKMQETP